jgi:glutamate racemase
VLACTHYPLLSDRFARLAPWPVAWIDPAPAIARRVLQLAGPPGLAVPADAVAVFTDGGCMTEPLRQALATRGLPRLQVMPMPVRPRPI